MIKHLLNAGAAALTLATLTVGATAVQSSGSTAAVIKSAEADAASASKALAKRKPEVAVRFAEQAVQLRPQDGTYRALLGKAYLAAGRFFSARQAFADALELDPGLPGVPLNLALATTAVGEFAAAQQILDTHAGSIGVADRGLALALAGNPAAGVDILLAVARLPGSDAKTRQNLALALALAGRWPDARQVALADLSPADADARIVQWASFARPTAASDQVSALLGVTPVADTGLPVQLALVSASTQVAEVAPAAAEPQQVAAVETAPAPVVVATPAVTEAAPVAVAVSAPEAPRPAPGVVFGERREVVQALAATPARPVRPTAAVRPVAPVIAPATAANVPASTGKGNFHVQIGAYSGAAMAKWGWDRATARYASLAGRTPSTMPIANGLVRLSVGGFNRHDAVQLCRSLRSSGRACFVRANAGDRVASWWGKGRTQVAAR